MADDDQTAASLAAKLRAQIRAELEAGLRLPPRPPAPMPVPAPAGTRDVIAPRRIPAAEGRPELALPDTGIPSLAVPSVITPGLSIAYAASDAKRGRGAGGATTGVGVRLVNVNVAGPAHVCMDVRHYFRPDVRLPQVLSAGCAAAVGDLVSSDIYWIHPVLLDALLGDKAPKLPEGVKVESVPFVNDAGRFEAVKISQHTKEVTSQFVHERDTGLLLYHELAATVAGADVRVVLDYQSRRQIALPWAGHVAPDWVGRTRSLVYQGGNTILLAGTTLQQAVTLSATLAAVGPSATLAKFSVVTDSGIGHPGERSNWELIAAPAMLYPLWLAPAAMRALTPRQEIDRDPATGFTFTFLGVEGDYGLLLEDGPLEQTTYYFDTRTGLFSGFRGQRPYGDGGGQMHTQTWLKTQG